MEAIYEIREKIIYNYKKYERYLLPIMKFIIVFILYSYINNSLSFNNQIMNLPFVLVITLFSVLVPLEWLYILLIFNIGTHFLSASIEGGIVLIVLMLCIYFMYARLFPKASLLIIILPMAYLFHIPYVIPLLAGLVIGITSIVPMGIGVIIWHIMPNIKEILNIKSEELLNVPQTFADIYMHIINLLTNDSRIMLFTIIIFSAVVIVMTVISKFEFDYLEYISVSIGGIINIIGFIIITLIMDIDINILGLILSTVFSVLILFIVNFFIRVLDYTRAEKVEFEDEDNYYYVKVIPKINISPKMIQKHIVKNEKEKYYEEKEFDPDINDVINNEWIKDED